MPTSQLIGFGVPSTIGPGATAANSVPTTQTTMVAQTTDRQRGDGGRPSGNTSSTSGTNPKVSLSVRWASQAASYPPG
jgi:hypothetical protein